MQHSTMRCKCSWIVQFTFALFYGALSDLTNTNILFVVTNPAIYSYYPTTHSAYTVYTAQITTVTELFVACSMHSTLQYLYCLDHDNVRLVRIDLYSSTRQIIIDQFSAFSITVDDISVFDSSGNYYIVYCASTRKLLYLYVPTNTMYSYMGSGTESISDGAYTACSFKNVKTMRLSHDRNNLWIGDSMALRKLDFSTSTVTTIIGGTDTGVVRQWNCINGPASTAAIGQVWAIAVGFSTTEKIYIMSTCWAENDLFDTYTYNLGVYDMTSYTILSSSVTRPARNALRLNWDQTILHWCESWSQCWSVSIASPNTKTGTTYTSKANYGMDMRPVCSETVCNTGYWRGPCTYYNSVGPCNACTNAPANTVYTGPGEYNSNLCTWQCNSGVAPSNGQCPAIVIPDPYSKNILYVSTNKHIYECKSAESGPKSIIFETEGDHYAMTMAPDRSRFYALSKAYGQLLWLRKDWTWANIFYVGGVSTQDQIAITESTQYVYYLQASSKVVYSLDVWNQQYWTIVGSSGSGSITDGDSSTSKMNIPRSMVWGHDKQYLLIADTMCIRKLVTSTNTLTTLLGSTQVDDSYYYCTEGSITQMRLGRINGIALRDSTYLYVSTTCINEAQGGEIFRILRVNLQTQTLVFMYEVPFVPLPNTLTFAVDFSTIYYATTNGLIKYNPTYATVGSLFGTAACSFDNSIELLRSITLDINLEITCTPGFKQDQYMNACEKCATGTYSTGVGLNVCTNCESGYWAGETGRTDCMLCAQGTKSGIHIFFVSVLL